MKIGARVHGDDGSARVDDVFPCAVVCIGFECMDLIVANVDAGFFVVKCFLQVMRNQCRALHGESRCRCMSSYFIVHIFSTYVIIH